jgi:hypothetical protein
LSRERRAPLGERLLAPFRVLAGGEELESAGATLLERACRALGAKEGLILLAEPEGSGPEGSSEPQVGYLPGPCWGAPGPGGRLGAREGDGGLAAAAVASARPVAAGAGGREAWCGMVVEGRTVGVLALRRAAGARFTGEELVAVELLATGAAVAVDRLRFLRLWSRKLEQADAAHSQLLRYADDLRTTFAAERRRAEQLREALDAAELAYIATVRALATAVEAKDAYTGGHLARVTAYGTEACRSIGGDLAATPGLEYAFLLHDLGKIGVPDAVLNKAGPLTDEEWALMREHPAPSACGSSMGCRRWTWSGRSSTPTTSAGTGPATRRASRASRPRWRRGCSRRSTPSTRSPPTDPTGPLPAWTRRCTGCGRPPAASSRPTRWRHPPGRP